MGIVLRNGQDLFCAVGSTFLLRGCARCTIVGFSSLRDSLLVRQH